MTKQRRLYGDEEAKKRAPARAKVTLEQKRARIEFIEALMVRGTATTTIEKACKEKFQIGKHAVLKYVDVLKAQWAEEERNSRVTNKATAQRRLYQHIYKAREAENWAAVAALERLLSDIQGTKEAVEVCVNVDATLTEATLHVVANLTPERRAAILAEQRKLRELAGRQQAPMLAHRVENIEESKKEHVEEKRTGAG